MGLSRVVRTGRTAVVAVVALALWGATTAVAPLASAVPQGRYSVVVQPEDGLTPVYRLIDSARHDVDLITYQLTDTMAVQKLVARQKAGIRTRVILDQRQQQVNGPAYTALKDGGVDVVWSDARFSYTHQKTLVVDGTTALVMTGNLVPKRYATYRDYGIVDTDPADVAAVERVFAADHAHAPVTPERGSHLVWSPTDARRQLLGLISRARTNLWVECLEMSDTEVIDALAAAARRHVQVTVVMTNTKNTYARAFDTLTAAGVRVSTYAPSDTPYIHAKAIVADHATAREQVFIGSENFTPTSLDKNRELGVILPHKAIADRVQSVIAHDFAGATPWTRKESSSGPLTTLRTTVNQTLSPAPAAAAPTG
ncbi:phospholipase D-like domain-containing protein [Streptomyces griseocarneus]|uniref:phospholipase D-like domain-containing protein n=1 Tax=Streptomyces griseocarneus TaxID=51201 RepID=UPI00167D4B5F|nr:phospholipase D-like domain-containing protein [Streptomyces griseocarneus]MBZ6475358.1 phospholipase D-like domain-containing protein [Streptomyces griseocarneus]GHG74803.1 hypothetical protein GCM10018779_51830 [Streptomyces griseocarneus]